MFVLSKLVWILIDPSTWLVVLALLLAYQSWRRKWNSVRRWSYVFGAASVILCAVPIGDWLLFPLENRFDLPKRIPADVAGIIVLGGAVDPVLTADRQQPQVNGRAERLWIAASLVKKEPSLKLYITGGSGSLFHQKMKEADVTRRLIQTMDIEAGRIVIERQSRNTWENAVLLHQRIKPDDKARFVLVTSAAHMPRAMGAFRKAGWRVVAWPVDYRTARQWRWLTLQPLHVGTQRLARALRAWIGLAGYYALGRSSAFFPAPEPRATQ